MKNAKEERRGLEDWEKRIKLGLILSLRKLGDV
jgi:hypothetical protein